MAVLGIGGILRLRREASEPTTVTPSSASISADTLTVLNPGFWSGDKVTLSSPQGIPVDTGNNGPDSPDGYGFYFGSKWLLGTNRSHITSPTSNFYKTDNDAAFYVRPADVTLTTSYTVFCYRDQLDRLSFYTTRAAALRGATADRLPIYNVDFGELQISSVVDNDAWKIQCSLSEWSLNLSAPEVDTTAVGERFGDSVKSIVTGGGTMDFLVDRTDDGVDRNDSTYLLNLLLLTEKGCKAEAEFWMIDNRADAAGLLPGDLYYETDLMVTSVAINTRATDLIAGSLNFVTVGQISLKMGTN